MPHAAPDEAPRRVVIAHMPRMLAEILVGLLEQEPELEVEGPVRAGAEPVDLLAGDPAAVIIGHHDGSLPEVGRELLLRRPTLVVVAIRQDGERAWIHRLVPSCEAVTELSAQQLATTLLDQIDRAPGSPWTGA